MLQTNSLGAARLWSRPSQSLRNCPNSVIKFYRPSERTYWSSVTFHLCVNCRWIEQIKPARGLEILALGCFRGSMTFWDLHGLIIVSYPFLLWVYDTLCISISDHIRMFMHFHQLGLIASHIVFQKSPAINLQSAAELQQIQDPELGRGPSVNQWGNVGSQLLLRPGVQQILDCQIVHLDIQILGCRDWENIQKGWDKLGWFQLLMEYSGHNNHDHDILPIHHWFNHKQGIMEIQ